MGDDAYGVPMDGDDVGMMHTGQPPQLPMDAQQMDQQQQDGAYNMQFSQEEVQHLREIFELFDREKNGTISIADLEAIMQSLNRDPIEAKMLLS